MRSLRFPLCLLAGLLAIAGFRIEGLEVSWLAVSAIVFAACSTMLQNDWRDRYHDLQKGKRLAAEHPREFLILLLILWIVTFSLTLIAVIENSAIGLVLIVISLAGLAYSEMRRIPLAATVLTALTSGSPALLSVAAGAEGSLSSLLFLSTSFIIFGREITKDMDDEWIDGGYKWTIPLAVGNKRAKTIALIMIMSGIVIAVNISTAILLAIPSVIISIVFLTCSIQLKIVRIFMDVGMFLGILALIFSN